MSTQSKRTMKFENPPETIFKVLTDPEFMKTNFIKQGHVNAVIREKSRSQDRLVLEAEVTEYAKGVTGIDKSKTEISYTVFTWDIAKRTAEWTYRSPHGERVKAWGSIRIEPAGGGTQLTEIFNIEIKIPLVGGRIEKTVISKADEHWPAYEELVKTFCAKM